MKKIDITNPADIIDKDVFELLGIKNVPEEKKKQILESMLATIQNRVIARILDLLNDDEIKEFEKLIDASDEKKINAFLASKKIDINQISAEESLLYKTEILNQVATAKTNPPPASK